MFCGVLGAIVLGVATWQDLLLALVPSILIIVNFYWGQHNASARHQTTIASQDQLHAETTQIHGLVNDRMDTALARIDDLEKQLAAKGVTKA